MEIGFIVQDNMRNDTCFMFNTDVLRHIDGVGATVLKVESVVAVFRAALNKLDAAIKKISKSEDTERIKNADKRRDTALTTIRTVTKAGLNHFSEEVKEAAKSLTVLLNTYKKTNSMPYQQQSSSVINLLQELRGDNYKNAVALLQLRAWVDELDMANQEVISLMDTRGEERIEKNKGNVKELRKNLDDAYREVRRMINAHAAIELTTPYVTVINKINQTISEYKTMMARLGGKKKEEK